MKRVVASMLRAIAVLLVASTGVVLTSPVSTVSAADYWNDGSCRPDMNTYCYPRPTCTKLHVDIPRTQNLGNYNHVNIGIEVVRADGSKFNLHLNWHTSGTYAPSYDFVYANHRDWRPEYLQFAVIWVQTASNNYHGQGRIECDLRPQEDEEINYHPNGAPGVSFTEVCAPDTTTSTAANPFVREGYTFTGWSSTADGSAGLVAPDTQISCVSGDFYAQWEKIPAVYTYIHHNNFDGATVTSNTCTEGTDFTVLAQQARDGYAFLGWNLASDGTGASYSVDDTVACQDITLYAQWEKIPAVYTYVHDNNFPGATVTSNTCTEGTDFTVLAQQVRDGYAFLGWNLAVDGTGASYAVGDTVACQNVTFYAQWEKIPAVYTYVHHNNFDGADVVTNTCTEGTDFTVLAQQVRDGYVFLGWNLASDGTGASYSVDDTVACQDITLYAQWEKIPAVYTYVHDNNFDGADVVTNTCTEGTDFTVLAQQVRDGYVFLGWNLAVDGTGASYAVGDTVACQDITLYAQWEKIPAVYTYIHHNNFPGATVTSNTCTEGTDFTVLAQQVREGYTFLGWNLAVDGTGASYAVGDSVACQDITLYAQWEQEVIVSHFAVYDNNFEGAVISEVDCVYGADLAVISPQVREGYTFSGWAVSKSGSGARYMPAAALRCLPFDANGTVSALAVTDRQRVFTLYAQWEKIPAVYTYVHDNNFDGADVVTNTCTEGTDFTVLAQQVREGYTFLGWNLASDGTGTGASYAVGDTVACQDITLYAQWEKIPAVYTYVHDNNFPGATVTSNTCTEGTDFTVLAQQARDGYVFLGWNLAVDGTGASYAVGDTVACQDTTLYAQWEQEVTPPVEPVSYTVLFDNNFEGAVVSDKVCDPGATVAVIAPQTRDGYVFLGWNLNADGTGDHYKVGDTINCQNITFYAQWEEASISIPEEHTVVFDNNFVDAIVSDKACFTGEVVAVIAPQTREGYTFLGWNLAADGSETMFAVGDTIACQDITFYAQWLQLSVDPEPPVVPTPPAPNPPTGDAPEDDPLRLPNSPSVDQMPVTVGLPHTGQDTPLSTKISLFMYFVGFNTMLLAAAFKKVPF